MIEKNGNMEHNILITGANGQLGHCLQDLAKEQNLDYKFFFTDVEELDICDQQKIEDFVLQNNIHAVINAAGYTAVDKAESDVETAYRLNRDAVAYLAQTARRHNIYLVHVSTDYVFSGQSCTPHREDDAIAPLSVYGKSKAAGEQAIAGSRCRATVVRTSWLYSEYGHNFVKTMLKLGREKDRLSVVSDQVGGPTYAGDLAEALFQAFLLNKSKPGMQIYHYADEGVTSWYDFAKAIMEMAGLGCAVAPVLTSEYPAAAPRPAYSVFDLRKTKKELGLEIPYWRDSLRLVINKLAGK